MVSIDLEADDDCIKVVNEAEMPDKEVENDVQFKKRLIMEVRKHRLLYDNKHKLFSNVVRKDLVWQQVASKLKSNVDDCKSIWFEVRYSYQRHVRRLRKFFIRGNKENRKRPAMYLEPKLIFLWRFIDNRKTCKVPFEIFEPEGDTVNTEDQNNLKLLEKVVVNDVENYIECNKIDKTPVDDDLILVEDTVDLIVIDEDDENGKSESQFNLTLPMKQLILQIKAYPELYDCEHALFKDYTRKSYVWNAIASHLGDKGTKLMKSWIIMQTRYEWEISQANRNATKRNSELQVHLDFLEEHIIKNPDTVYKQSYSLKKAWYQPIDYFKDIYNLIVRMKKMPEIVYITDSVLRVPEKNKRYLVLWSSMASLKDTAGQCETTWLIMRYFYWELLHMREQNYQLTDKWYFENIINELYAISKAAQPAQPVQPVQPAKVQETLKDFRPKNKRTAQTAATSLGASNSKIPTPPPPATVTMQMNPTIVNHLQSSPVINLTHTTQQPINDTTQLTLPKITAAISLAPQALNSGSLQIKQISGPPTLSPAPPPYAVSNGMPMATAPTASVVPKQMPMSFNLPTKTTVTSLAMPTLIRPMVPQPNIQPAVGKSSHATISLRNKPRAIAPKIQLAPWATMPPAVHNTIPNPVPNAMPTVLPRLSPINTSSGLSPQINENPQKSTLGSGNCSNISPYMTCPQSMAALKSTTVPQLTSAVSPGFNNSSTPPNTSTFTSANNGELPKITGAISLLNPNEILIELISSQSGNQLVIYGPLSAKYELCMPVVAKFIREILAIPLLHNKRSNQPILINTYWEFVSSMFNLPVHICRACWNFLLENFSHFPQIAPMKDLMKPFETSLNVWTESFQLFRKLADHCANKCWYRYMPRLPEVVECIGNYPVLYQDIAKHNSAEMPSEMEMLCAWRTINLRFPNISEIPEIWTTLKAYFSQYMTDIEFGIENRWHMIWWRSLAKLKFLVQARYSANEPFYYIVANKMAEEIDKCASVEMKIRSKHGSSLPESNDEVIPQLEIKQIESNDVLPPLTTSPKKGKLEVEFGALVAAIHKQPVIYNKADNMVKYEAWKKVAQELQMDVTDCILAFKHATEMYFTYKKQDLHCRCRINEKYYKKFDDIVQNFNKVSTNLSKLNIKTPFELNNTIESDKSSNTSDLVFPERYISDINMTNSPSNLVVKNWVFALGNINSYNCGLFNSKLKGVLNKYLPNL